MEALESPGRTHESREGKGFVAEERKAQAGAESDESAVAGFCPLWPFLNYLGDTNLTML